MKHILHAIKSGHLHCDVLDDQDNLVIGGLMVPVDTTPADMDSYFRDVVYPMIESMITTAPMSDTVQIDASPILVAMEDSKERIKFDLIGFIKTTPKATVEDLMTYTEQTHGWENAGLVMKMMAEYVKQAEQKQMIPPVEVKTKEDCFAVLQQIILNTDIAVLQEMLK